MSRFSPDRCPLCGQGNACAMEAQKATGQPQPPCWCLAMDFTPALLASVPPAARDRACICAACATRAQALDQAPDQGQDQPLSDKARS